MAVHARVPSATLTDILAVCAKGAANGLSHSGQARLIGETFWYGGLHHESGESIYTEHPIPVPDKGLPGQRQQDWRSITTPANIACRVFTAVRRRGLDPMRSATASAKASCTAPAPRLPAPMPVTVEKPEQRVLSDEEKKLPFDHQNKENAEWKRIHGSSTPRKTPCLDGSTLEHLQFLEALQINVPFESHGRLQQHPPSKLFQQLESDRKSDKAPHATGSLNSALPT